MQVTLYETVTPNEYADKVLTSASARVCNLIYPVDIESPNIKLAYSGNFAYNYASLNIDGILRYYYIDGKTIENQTITLRLKEDYLMTWRASIRASKGLITRSRQGNRYIKDNLATPTDKTAWQFRELGTCLQAECNYILIKTGI